MTDKRQELIDNIKDLIDKMNTIFGSEYNITHQIYNTNPNYIEYSNSNNENNNKDTSQIYVINTVPTATTATTLQYSSLNPFNWWGSKPSNDVVINNKRGEWL